jgi:hypothetical protein
VVSIESLALENSLVLGEAIAELDVALQAPPRRREMILLGALA